MKLIVPTAFGTESVTARELMDLGYTDQMTENGKVILRKAVGDCIDD
jgi:23S rRNA G2445 N2-methylase RlmL